MSQPANIRFSLRWLWIAVIAATLAAFVWFAGQNDRAGNLPTGQESPPPAASTASPTPPPEPRYLNAAAIPHLAPVAQIGKGQAHSVAWSPDGKLIAVTTAAGLYLYDAAAMLPAATLERGTCFERLAFSADSQLLAASTCDFAVWAWQMPAGTRLHTFEGHRDAITALAFSPDASRLASASPGSGIRLWEPVAGKLVETIELKETVVALAFSPDGRTLAAALPRVIQVMSLPYGLPQQYNQLSGLSLQAVAFDPTGMWLLTANLRSQTAYQHGYLTAWETANGKLTRREDLEISAAHHAAFSADGNWLAAASRENDIWVWDTVRAKTAFILEGEGEAITALALRPDGQKVAAILENRQLTLWDVAARRRSATLGVFSDAVESLAISRDGHLLASADLLGNVQLWELPGGIQIERLTAGKITPNGNFSPRLQFSPDGRSLAWEYGNQSVRLWDTATLEAQRQIPWGGRIIERMAFHPGEAQAATTRGGELHLWASAPLTDTQAGEANPPPLWQTEAPGSSPIRQLAFSPDGEMLVTSGKWLERWEARTGETLDQYLYEKIPAEQAIFSPDGSQLAVISGKWVELRDPYSLALQATIQSSHGVIRQAVFNPAGDVLATLSAGGKDEPPVVEFWEAHSGRRLFTLPSNAQPITSLAFTPDGYTLITGSAQGVMRLWQAVNAPFPYHTPPPTATPTPRPPATPTLSPPQITDLGLLGLGSAAEAALSPDGSLLAVGTSAGLRLYDAHTLALRRTVEIQNVPRLFFSSDSQLLLADGVEQGIHIITVATGEITPTTREAEKIAAAAFSTDGRFLSVVDEECWRYCEDYLRTVETTTGRNLWVFFPWEHWEYSPRFKALSISPDSRLLAAASSDNNVYLFDLQTGELRQTLAGHAAAVTSVAFSPNGRWLASGGEDGLVRLWNPASGQLERQLAGFPNDITGLSFSADGKQLTAEALDNPPQTRAIPGGQLLDVPASPAAPTAAELLRRLRLAEGWSSPSAHSAFSPAGRTLAQADDEALYLWDVAARRLKGLVMLPTGSGCTSQLLYAPAGDRLYLLSEERLLVWDALAEAWLPPIELPIEYASQVALSPDGRLLAIGSQQQILLVEAASGRRLATLLADGWIGQLSFSPDGKALYLLDNASVEAWEIPSGRKLSGFGLQADTGSLRGSVVHGSRLYLTWQHYPEQSGRRNMGGIWDLTTGQLVLALSARSDSNAFAVSPDGRTLLAYSDSEEDTPAQLQLWDALTGRLLHSQPFGRDIFYPRPLLSPDGQTLAWEDSLGQIHLWEIGPALETFSLLSTPAGIPTPLPTRRITTTPTPRIAPPAFTPLPTATPAAIHWADLQPRVRIGRGAPGRASWSPDGKTLLIPSTWGVYAYAAADLSDAGFTESGSPLEALAPKKDGGLWAAGSLGDTVSLWDIGLPGAVEQFPGNSPVSISPDGRWWVYRPLADDGTLETWDIEAGQPGPRLFGAYDYPIFFSPDGRLAAANRGGDTRVWELASGKIVAAFNAPGSRAASLAFSPNGSLLAVGDYMGNVKIWDIASQTVLQTLTLYAPEVWIDDYYNYSQNKTWPASLTFSPDGRQLAAGGNDGSLQRVTWSSGQVAWRVAAHTGGVQQALFHPDGRSLVTLDANGTLALWDIRSGTRLGIRQEHAAGFNGLQFQNDGRLAAWRGSALWLADPGSGEIVQISDTFSGTIYAASHDSRQLLVYGPAAQFWQVQAGQAVFSQTLGSWPAASWNITLAAFSQDDRLLVAADSAGAWVWYRGEATPRTIGNEYTDVRRLALRPDGNLLVTHEYDNRLAFWKFGSIPLKAREPIWRGSANALALSPSGEKLAACQNDSLVVLDTLTGDIVHSLPLAEGCTALAFSPDGRWIAFGDELGMLQVWDLAADNPAVLPTVHRGAILFVAFSPDGRLAAGGKDGAVWVYAPAP